MSDTGRHPFEPATQLERLVFFSDAVFAIALTLLVIDIALPEAAGRPGGPSGLDALRDLLPRIATFVLSFAVVGLYWVGHHRFFGFVRAFDGRVIALNFLLLLFVVFIPFPTSFIGAYGDDPTGPVFYALANAGAGISQALLWMYLARTHLLDPRVTPQYVTYRLANLLRIPVVFLASIPIAIWISPYLAEASWLAFFGLGLVMRRTLGRVEPFGADPVATPDR